LRDKSTACIRTLSRATRGMIPIVGVGGVSSARDALQKLKAGASLVQVYSAMVYQGPGLIAKMRTELAQAVLDEGKRSVKELIGMDHEELYWQRQEDRQAVRRRYQSRVVAKSAGVVATSSSADGNAAANSGLLLLNRFVSFLNRTGTWYHRHDRNDSLCSQSAYGY
jgi:imidazole glycerol phosphate synthase subunit HisF